LDVSQIPLFDLSKPQPPLRFSDSSTSASRPFVRGQGDLFEDRPALIEGDILRALESGDFEDAQRLLADRLDELAAFDQMQVLSTLPWRSAGFGHWPSEALADSWELMVGSLRDYPAALAAVNRGMVTTIRSAGMLSATLDRHPILVPHAANALDSHNQDEALLARELVRDALVRGYEVDPGAIRDALVSDLLAENEAPRWLACLGVIRRLWHPRRYSSSEIQEWRASAQFADANEDNAWGFWCCLCVEWSTTDKPILEEARRRMKFLRADWHEAWMER